MNRFAAEQYLLDLAQKAEVIDGSHIERITLKHEDCRKLAAAVRALLAVRPQPAG